MEKTKICPSCGAENSADTFFCFNCNADISFVVAIEHGQDERKVENTMKEKPLPKTVKCPNCAKINAFNTPFCTRCFTLLATEFYEPLQKGEHPHLIEIRPAEFYLEFPWGVFQIKDQMIIGREDASPEIRKPLMDSYKNLSKKHASFKIKNNTLYLYDHGSANGTFINDILLPNQTLLAIRKDCPVRFAKDLIVFVKIIYND